MIAWYLHPSSYPLAAEIIFPPWSHLPALLPMTPGAHLTLPEYSATPLFHHFHLYHLHPASLSIQAVILTPSLRPVTYLTPLLRCPRSSLGAIMPSSPTTGARSPLINGCWMSSIGVLDRVPFIFPPPRVPFAGCEDPSHHKLCYGRVPSNASPTITMAFIPSCQRRGVVATAPFCTSVC